MHSTITEPIYREYLSALVHGELDQCARLVRSILDNGTAVETLYFDLFQRSMYEVGELWASNQLSIAVEHLATAITFHMLGLAAPVVLAGAKTNPVIVIACVTDEFHQLGGRMIADLCALRGWQSHFLGANASAERLLQKIEEVQPALLGLSISLMSGLPKLFATLDRIRASCPDLPIVIGGQGLRTVGAQELQPYRNVHYVASIAELEERLATFENHGGTVHSNLK